MGKGPYTGGEVTRLDAQGRPPCWMSQHMLRRLSPTRAKRCHHGCMRNAVSHGVRALRMCFRTAVSRTPIHRMASVSAGYHMQDRRDCQT